MLIQVINLLLTLIALSFSQIIIAPNHYSSAAGGETCVGLLVCQNFEGTGYDNGETWVEAGTPLPDEDATATVLRGSQSLSIADGTGATYIVISSTGTIYAHWLYEVSDGTPIGNAVTMSMQTGTGLRWYISHRTTGYLRVYNGTINVTGTTTLMADNTTYHIWGLYTPGTGANGVSTLWVGTSTARPGTAEATVTTGDATTNIDRVYCQNVAAGDFTVLEDQVLVDDVEFTSVYAAMPQYEIYKDIVSAWEWFLNVSYASR